MDNRQLKPIFTEKQIQQRVKQIGQAYGERLIHMVAILEDAFVFIANLVRSVICPVICHFLKTVIRDVPDQNRPIREVFFTQKIDVMGQDILRVKGTLQSGITSDLLFHHIHDQYPRSVQSVILVDKKRDQKVDVPTNYVAFDPEENFLVGYGLSHQERYRLLPYLAAI